MKSSVVSFYLPRVLGLGLVAGLLCMATPLVAAEAASNLQAGFYLLHNVCDEESQVHLITVAKTTPADVTDYVNRVSKIADESLKTLDGFEDRDPSLKLDRNPLPQFEQKVRKAIKADKQHNLLFGTTDAAFARALLFSQVEASNYIMHMAQVLADEDPNAHQTRELLKISARWEKLRNEGVRLSAGR